MGVADPKDIAAPPRNETRNENGYLLSALAGDVAAQADAAKDEKEAV